MRKNYLLGIDQGTSGSRALIIDREGRVRSYAYRPLARLYPRPDWVEQDPTAVSAGVAQVISEAIGQAGCRPDEIVACGLTCQRNTDFVWDARNGRALANAITWQDLRTIPLLKELAGWPPAAAARRRLGYAPGAYMSALHLAWRMRHDPAVRAAAADGSLRVGLSAAWLLNDLGRPAGHQMDASLVQALGLYDFRAGDYWAEWLDWLQVPRAALPTAVPTIHEFGSLRVHAPDGAAADAPVLAMIGDQQAALFGQGGRTPGAAESTQGTASYVKLFMGREAPDLDSVNVYYAWDVGQGQTYCLEAPTTVVGAAIRWMRDDARFFDAYAELGPLAASVPTSGGVVFVPAFTGLDVPYNNPDARATILGLTLGTHRGHIVRAFLESLGFQMRAILETIAQDTGLRVAELLVGGGVTASDEACQIQADLTGVTVLRPTFAESTAWAAALLAGLGAGVWPGVDALPPTPGDCTRFEPRLGADERDAGYGRWREAIALVQAYSGAPSQNRP
jgi:glycerol kinase